MNSETRRQALPPARRAASLAAAYGLLSLPMLAQGYFIARPMPTAELPEWIADWEQRRCVNP